MSISSEINRIDIEWWELFDTIRGLRTEVQNRIVIEREVIPIIFVPGIMGSRLKFAKGKRSGKRAWDPDSSGFMFLNYGRFDVSAKKKKALLIGSEFDPCYLEVDTNNPELDESFLRRYPGADKRGWGGVMWGSYGPILRALHDHRWEEPAGHCFEFPVHAFGYNWTASNLDAGRKLKEYIDATIDHYARGLKDEAGRPLERLCSRVILVTHSMGGLVARSVCVLHGAAEKVLGVVHGVQPATGSPAAYWRMKAGFERPAGGPRKSIWDWFLNPVKMFERWAVGNTSAWILGTDGEEVTALLGNMPGGLQLLPTKEYRDNGGSRQWLAYPGVDGRSISLPKSDPYEEIYRVQDNVPWRMVNPEWLDPGNLTGGSKSYRGKTPLDHYEEYLLEAESFHDKLGSRVHGETVQFYSTTLDSPDRIIYRREPHAHSAHHRFRNKGAFRAYVDGKDRVLNNSEGAVEVVTLEPFAGTGDGTVPDSSGKALKVPTARIGREATADFFSIDHQGIYGTDTAKEIVFTAVWNLAVKRIEEKVGRRKGKKSEEKNGIHATDGTFP